MPLVRYILNACQTLGKFRFRILRIPRKLIYESFTVQSHEVELHGSRIVFSFRKLNNLHSLSTSNQLYTGEKPRTTGNHSLFLMIVAAVHGKHSSLTIERVQRSTNKDAVQLTPTTINVSTPISNTMLFAGWQADEHTGTL
jgi:hypothetical protein